MWQKDTRFQIQGPTGSLACATMIPAIVASHRVGVICHPDPKGGGSMDNKVVTTIARAMRDVGMISVRFNYRGVGDSEGVGGDGTGEAEDCLALIQWLRRERTDCQIVLAGFSFGAFVAQCAACKAGFLSGMLSVAPAVTLRPFAGLAGVSCPWLVIQGGKDELVAARAVQAWVQQLATPVQFKVIDEASHFFHGHLVALKTQIVDFLKKVNDNHSQ